VGEDTLYHGEPDRVNGALDRIRAVTVADVQRLAQQKLRPERATVVRVDVKARTEEAGR
jgi:predicted Zn-dependent peptidase